MKKELNAQDPVCIGEFRQCLLPYRQSERTHTSQGGII